MKKPDRVAEIDQRVATRLAWLERLIDEEYGGSTRVFQDRTGIKMSQVSQWFSGYRALRDKALRRLEEVTGKGEGWFDQSTDLLDLSGGVLARGSDQRRLIDPDPEIPQYEAGGAMGHGLVLEDRPPGLIKSWKVDQEWLRLNVRHHSGIQNLRIVTGFGPSMRGMFNPGDPLLCDCGVTTVEVDAVYFFRVGEHGFIKMLQRIPTVDGILLRAKSKNPDYDPFDITPKMLAQEGLFEVFGKILTVWKSEVL